MLKNLLNTRPQTQCTKIRARQSKCRAQLFVKHLGLHVYTVDSIRPVEWGKTSAALTSWLTLCICHRSVQTQRAGHGAGAPGCAAVSVSCQASDSTVIRSLSSVLTANGHPAIAALVYRMFETEWMGDCKLMNPWFCVCCAHKQCGLFIKGIRSIVSQTGDKHEGDFEPLFDRITSVWHTQSMQTHTVINRQ